MTKMRMGPLAWLGSDVGGPQSLGDEDDLATDAAISIGDLARAVLVSLGSIIENATDRPCDESAEAYPSKYGESGVESAHGSDALRRFGERHPVGGIPDFAGLTVLGHCKPSGDAPPRGKTPTFRITDQDAFRIARSSLNRLPLSPALHHGTSARRANERAEGPRGNSDPRLNCMAGAGHAGITLRRPAIQAGRTGAIREAFPSAPQRQ
jgi:hypothetical protein